jgi:hypothetical protein
MSYSDLHFSIPAYQFFITLTVSTTFRSYVLRLSYRTHLIKTLFLYSELQPFLLDFLFLFPHIIMSPYSLFLLIIFLTPTSTSNKRSTSYFTYPCSLIVAYHHSIVLHSHPMVAYSYPIVPHGYSMVVHAHPMVPYPYPIVPHRRLHLLQISSRPLI